MLSPMIGSHCGAPEAGADSLDRGPNAAHGRVPDSAGAAELRV